LAGGSQEERDMTTYRLRKLARKIRNGTAIVRGRASGGDRWPDEPHFWIVDDCETQQTYHVPVADRPSWGRYVDPR
jgi:hypothetical protein